MKNKNSATPPAELAERGLDYDCVITPERIAAASAETMTPFPAELEALMPEPDHSLDNGSQHYFTADQVRQAMLDATERAAKLVDAKRDASPSYRDEHWICSEIAKVIRGDGGQGS